MLTRRRLVMCGLAAIGAVTLCAVPVAFSAPAKDRDVRVRGTCTNTSSAKLKLSAEDGRIEVEFELDQNRVGRKWMVVFRQNGLVVRRLTKVTRAPSGSFEARVVTTNRAGADRFVVTGSRPGEVCTARAAI